MRAFAVLGPAAATIVLVLGGYLTAVHHRGSVPLLVIGAAGALFWLVMIPLARRRAKI